MHNIILTYTSIIRKLPETSLSTRLALIPNNIPINSLSSYISQVNAIPLLTEQEEQDESFDMLATDSYDDHFSPSQPSQQP